MTLIDENEFLYEQERKRKIFRNIVKWIIILLIIVVILTVFRLTLGKKTFKCKIDGDINYDVSDDILLKDERGRIYNDNGNVYVSISKLANTLKCQFYNSEYKKKGEDKTKCQIKTENIYTSYVSGSNKIYKAIVTENTDNEENHSNNDEFEEIEDLNKVEFEYFTISDNIRYENNDIYGSLEAIALGFDVAVNYNSKNNTLSISSLDALEKVAKVKRKKDVVDSSEYSYRNKRLLKYGMVVVKDSDGNIGVGSYTDKEKLGSYVASCKYNQIEFNEGTKTFSAITSNDNKNGLLYVDVDTQEVQKNMSPVYSEIKEITDKFDYFVVKENGKYGIIDANGNIVIPTKFDDMGIKEEKYSDITCKYILNDKYVPVKMNGLWGLYSIQGLELISPKYADIGCCIAQSGDSAVIIDGLKDGVTGIVFLYDKEQSFYGIFNAENGEKIAISLTEVFKKVENDKESYYINHIIDRRSSKVHTINVRTDI